MNVALGRYVYGIAAIACGICGLVFHDFSGLQQVKALGDASHHQVLTSIVGALEILGGAAILLPQTARAGSALVGAIFAVFALLAIPSIVAHPLVYNAYGNFFEQLSMAAGPAILSPRLARIGYYAFGACVMSFALEQLFYLSATAGLVPTWIPPGGMFWAIVTTAALALGSIALLAGLAARLASLLTTAMLLGFGLLVWVPALFADPHSFSNWAEGTETLAIAASAWIVADFVRRRGSRPAA